MFKQISYRPIEEVYADIQRDKELIRQHSLMYDQQFEATTRFKMDTYVDLVRQFTYRCAITASYCPANCKTGPYIHPQRLTNGEGTLKSKVYIDREWIWSDLQINKTSIKLSASRVPRALRGPGPLTAAQVAKLAKIAANVKPVGRPKRVSTYSSKPKKDKV